MVTCKRGYFLVAYAIYSTCLLDGVDGMNHGHSRRCLMVVRGQRVRFGVVPKQGQTHHSHPSFASSLDCYIRFWCARFIKERILISVGLVTAQADHKQQDICKWKENGSQNHCIEIERVQASVIPPLFDPPVHQCYGRHHCSRHPARPPWPPAFPSRLYALLHLYLSTPCAAWWCLQCEFHPLQHCKTFICHGLWNGLGYMTSPISLLFKGVCDAWQEE